MEIEYEIKDKKLKELVEKKSKELHSNVNDLIWGYINRGLMEDNMGEEEFRENHSKKFLKEINDALGLDDSY